MQIERGAVGICCAKLGEAEVFADAGIADIRLPYPLNPVNADRVFALAGSDRALVHRRRSGGRARSGRHGDASAARTLDVLVKVDVGFHRCGIDPRSPSAAQVVAGDRVAAGPALRGLLSHAGHAYAADVETARCAAIASREAAAPARSRGARPACACEEISVGATPTARFTLAAGRRDRAAARQLRLLRSHAGRRSARPLDDCALTVLARVVSRPAPRSRSSSTAAARR